MGGRLARVCPPGALYRYYSTENVKSIHNFFDSLFALLPYNIMVAKITCICYNGGDYSYIMGSSAHFGGECYE